MIKSDFTRSLAEHSLAEDEAETCHQKITLEDKVTNVSKEQNVKHEEQESTKLKRSFDKRKGFLELRDVRRDAVLRQVFDRCVPKRRRVKGRCEVAPLRLVG